MPLVTGTWTINANGAEGDLIIVALNPDGSISGTVFGTAFSGFWNETGQSIFFESMMPIVITADGLIVGGVGRAQFTGYLFSTQPSPPVGSDIKWTLCGHLSTPATNGLFVAQPNSHRTVFGWFANVTQVV